MSNTKTIQQITQSIIGELRSLVPGQNAVYPELVSRHGADQLPLMEQFGLFSAIKSALLDEGYLLECAEEEVQKGCSFFPTHFHLIPMKEMPAISDHAPMGWNSWDCYGASVTEEIVRQNADYMAAHLKDAGYEYVVVDIQWSEPKMVGHMYSPFTDLNYDAYGRLMPVENRFPSSANGAGFKPLADYVHSLGLKFGIHIMRGIPRKAVHENTPVLGSSLTARQVAQTDSICHWNTDMYGLSAANGGKAYYDSIFRLYADWGVDFIKIDDICREMPKEEDELIIVSNAIQECGRDMILSLSPGPALPEKAELYKKTAHMWRITDDFWDQWDLLYDMFKRAETWCIHAGAGHYPDADMLPVGQIRVDMNGGAWTAFTQEEQITMLSLWCMLKAPLMIGGEMTSFDDFTLNLLTNPDILAMQKYGRHPHPVWRKKIDGIEHVLWTSQNSMGGQYAALFNLGETASEISVSLKDLEIYSSKTVRELWTGQIQEHADTIQAKLPPHSASVYLIS